MGLLCTGTSALDINQTVIPGSLLCLHKTPVLTLALVSIHSHKPGTPTPTLCPSLQHLLEVK